MSDRTWQFEERDGFTTVFTETGKYVCEAEPEHAPLIAKAPDLLASVKELRDALAGAMRVIADNDLVDDFMDEIAQAGVKNGVGVRADALIAEIEGAP